MSTSPAAVARSVEAEPAQGTERPHRSRIEWLDRFAGSDPGLNRLMLSLQAVCAIAAAMGGGWLFVHFTRAMQLQTHGAALSAAQAATVAAANHEFLVIGELLAAIFAMTSSFGIADRSARGQLLSTLLAPIPFVATIAAGLALGHHRLACLILLAFALAAGQYLRRFGPRGFLTGLYVFLGFFMGFFLSKAIGIGDIGWVAAEIGVGLVASSIVRFAFFYPRPARALARTQRSYQARARKVLRLAQARLDGGDDPSSLRRLNRQLVRLNETALMVDAHLGGGTVPGPTALRLHELLFDAELAVTNIARFAEAMARMDLPADQRDLARQSLGELIDGRSRAARDTARRLGAWVATSPSGTRARTVTLHRFVGCVANFATSLDEWLAVGEASDNESAATVFQPAVELFAGWLPGAMPASATASQEGGAGRWNRALAPYTRAAVQIGIAAGLAITVGVQINGYRFYWALLAVFVTFMGTSNSGEQITKAAFRVLGTLIGIAIGSLLVNLVGHDVYASITVILVALFLGLYLMRTSYAFMVIGVTVMVSQLYVQLGEFSNHLLLIRLAETAAGAAIAALTVSFVLPLRTRAVVRVALRSYLEALGRLVGHASDRVLTGTTDAELRLDARTVDSTNQTLISAVTPLRKSLFGDIDHDIAEVAALASATRHYARNLVADVEALYGLAPDVAAIFSEAARTLDGSIQALTATDEARDRTYTRSAGLFEQAEQLVEAHDGAIVPAQLVIRDLKLLDGALARLAEEMGLTLANYDTATV